MGDRIEIEKIELRCPVSVIDEYREVAAIALTDVATVMQVVIAMQHRKWEMEINPGGPIHADSEGGQ